MEEEQDIQSDIVKQKQLRDAQENQEFDDAVAGGELEDLREGVKIRQREKSEVKKDILESINNPLAKSIAFETGANVALDTATGWFMPAPWLYAGINFVGSSAINIAAQRMRGQRGINFGEVGASGLISTVPYMNPAAGRFSKLVGQQRSLQRAAVGGGVMAVAHQQIEAGVNEGRVISPTEAAVGLGLGAATGTAFKEVGDQLGKRLKFAIDRSPLTAQRTGTVGAQVNPAKAAPKISTNERLKQSLIANEVIELPPAYKGGPVTFREEADFFDVSAALIGGGQEDARDALGRKIDYNRAKVTEFGATRSERRDMVFNHIKDRLRRKKTKGKQKGTGTNITRKEFNEYAKEQVAAEKNLRKAIKLLNIRSYASLKNIDLSDYPTSEAQLELLNKINKAKVKPRRSKTDTTDQFQNKVRKWQRDTAPYQQFTDYKETFDYGHIISAKTGFRAEDLGMNRISNTEIEAAHNVASIDPYTRKIIEILQEGNRERGSRRDYVPVVQRMRNTAGSVVEDFVKWKANKDNDPVNLTKILDKFIPRDQHDNYLQFVQKKFYQKRALGYSTMKEFVEEVYGFDYKIFKEMPQKHKNKVEKEYLKQRVESGNITGKQQYDQAGEWMLEAIDEFIGLHHLSKPKRLRTIKEDTQLQDLDDLPKDVDDLMDMILPDRLPNE